MGLLLHLNGVDEALWANNLQKELGDYPVYRRSDDFDAGEINYLLAWKPDEDAFDGLNNLKAILSIGAGVDAILRHKHLPHDVPLVRFVDEELSQCMSDYVVANVTMHHRMFCRYKKDQQDRNWGQLYPPPAWDINVGMMGLGVLGQHALSRLKPLKFNLFGWSRSAKQIDGVQCYSGAEGFDAFLDKTDILVNLLPLTPETQGVLNYETFSKLRRGVLDGGPVIVNAARGGHQKETDIVRALNDGTLGAASLDVFEVEPLPRTSQLWDLENCFITPHIAAISQPNTGQRYFARVILDHLAGKPLVNLVDVSKGY